MSEEKTKESTGIENSEGSTSDEKQSTKTFTQSDFDKAIMREKIRMEEQYGDYKTIKEQNDALLSEKKKQEEAQMSEIQKANAVIEELTSKSSKLETLLSEAQIKNLKSDVLSRIEYNILPRAYKNLVTGDTEDGIKTNADEVLEEYKKDMAKIGKTPDFQPPDVAKTQPTGAEVKTFQEKLKEKLGQRFGTEPKVR